MHEEEVGTRLTFIYICSQENRDIISIHLLQTDRHTLDLLSHREGLYASIWCTRSSYYCSLAVCLSGAGWEAHISARLDGLPLAALAGRRGLILWFWLAKLVGSRSMLQHLGWLGEEWRRLHIRSLLSTQSSLIMSRVQLLYRCWVSNTVVPRLSSF